MFPVLSGVSADAAAALRHRRVKLLLQTYNERNTHRHSFSFSQQRHVYTLHTYTIALNLNDRLSAI